MDVVYVIVVSALAFGSPQLGVPKEAAYRKAFVSKDACDKRAEVLSRKVKGSPFPGIEVKGAVCIPLEVVK